MLIRTLLHALTPSGKIREIKKFLFILTTTTTNVATNCICHHQSVLHICKWKVKIHNAYQKYKTIVSGKYKRLVISSTFLLFSCLGHKTFLNAFLVGSLIIFFATLFSYSSIYKIFQWRTIHALVPLHCRRGDFECRKTAFDALKLHLELLPLKRKRIVSKIYCDAGFSLSTYSTRGALLLLVIAWE